ncbi:MAG: VCBS repeat-containing protein, partial [candidate division WOR-3 bacterium]
MARMRTTAFLLILLLAAAGSRAWDIGLMMTRRLDGPGMSASGLFDLDADSVPELLVPGNKRLYCLDTAGVEQWRFEPASQYFPAVSSPLAADIDNDGQADVVVSTPLAVYRLTADGDSVWRRTLAGQGVVQNCIASTALGDINADSMLEVFCYEVYANRLLCLDPETGDTVWTFRPGKDARFSVGAPTVADLDQDGRPEVVGVVTDSSGGRTYCL